MRSWLTTQVPGVYHRKLGVVLVTGLSDGYVDVGYEISRDISETEIQTVVDRE